jgi:Carboxypeptidase regulatory-like domain
MSTGSAKLNPMLRRPLASGMIIGLFLLCSAAIAWDQTLAFHAPVVLTVVDENGRPVSEAHVTVSEPGRSVLQLETDYAGRCTYSLHQNAPYQIRVEKPGFYQTLESQADAHLGAIEVALAYEQVVRQEVSVAASPTGIDPEQTSDKSVMNTPEIVNVPYPTSRDIHNLLPFNPGVIQDASG